MSAELRPVDEYFLPQRFRLAGRQVDLTVNCVTDGNRERRFTPKAGAVLAYMAARWGTAVTREDLMNSVWADAFPTDDVLSHAIAELRRALGDSARNSRIIETIPKVGYRLILEPEPLSDSASESSPGRPRNRTILGGLAIFAAGLLLGVGLMSLRDSRPLPMTTTHTLSDPMADAIPVTSDPAFETMPNLSPDGRRIAYVVGKGADRTDIMIREQGAGSGQLLTTTPDASEYSPAWSPDGRSIALLRFDEKACHVVIVPVAGGRERQLAECARDAITYVDWSPDGQTLAMSYSTEGRMASGIYLLDVQSGENRPLDYNLSDEHDVQPKYSRDGRWIAFRRGANPRSELYLINADGGQARALTDFGSRLHGFDWLPDSRHLWFCAENQGIAALWQVAVDGSPPMQVSTGCPFNISIANDARTLAFERHSGDSNILRMGELGAFEQTHFASTQHERQPAFSPDGSQIVFVSNRSGDEQLWIGAVDGEPEQLTRLAGLTISHPTFTADAQSVLFLGNAGNRESLYQVNLTSGIVERITQADERVRSAYPGIDGAIYITSDRSGSWQIWRLDGPDSATRLTTDGGHWPMISGGFMYYTKLDRYGLWRVPLAGGVEEPISDEISFANHMNWFVRDGDLYLSHSKENGSVSVRRQTLNSEDEGRTVAEFPPGREISLEDVSANGDWLLFTESRNSTVDIATVLDF